MKNSKIKTVKNIVKAFTNELPINEKWFQDRIAICETCPLNSKNIPEEQWTTEDKLKRTIRLCPEGDHCTACGCCTHRKASQMSEECGATEIGQPAKWSALEVSTRLSSGLDISNLTPDTGDLVINSEGIVYDIGETNKDLETFEIKIRRKAGLDVKVTTVGCKCTVAGTEVIDSKTAKFKVSVSTKDFRVGQKIKRTFTVEHYAKSNKVEKIEVIIRLIKK